MLFEQDMGVTCARTHIDMHAVQSYERGFTRTPCKYTLQRGLEENSTCISSLTADLPVQPFFMKRQNGARQGTSSTQ